MIIAMDYNMGFEILFLTSMLLQVILAVFGSFRKRCSKKWFTFFLWSAYQLASVVATTALGLMTNQSTDVKAVWSIILLWHLGGPDSITALALVDNQLFRRHSVQLVYLVGVAGYVLVKNYLGFEDDLSAIDWIEPMIWYFAGISKYGEKIWALHSADMGSLRDSMFPPPNLGPTLEISNDDDDDDHHHHHNNVVDAQSSTSMLIPMDKYVYRVVAVGAMVPAEGTSHGDSMIPPNLGQGPVALNFNDDCANANDAQSIPMPTPTPTPMDESASRRSLEGQLDSHQTILLRGHHYFCIFRCLFVDIMVPNSHIIDSRRFFLQVHPCEIAFQLIDVELRFVYDMLFTKAPVVRTWLGYALRLLRISILLDILVKYYLDLMVYLPSNPIFWVFTQEMYEVVQMLLSEWTVVWLNNHNFNWLSMIILRLILACRLLVSKIICFCSSGEKAVASETAPTWWYSNIMAQYNLLSLCFKDEPTMFKRLLYLSSWGKSIHEWVEKNRNTTYMHIPNGIKDFIYQQLIHTSDEIRSAEFRNSRGKWVMIKRNSCLEELGWSVDVEFDQSILIWHVATDFCYYSDNLGSDICEATTIDLDLEVQVSKALSNYLLYILCVFPSVLNSKIGMIGFQDTYVTIKKLFDVIKNKRQEKSKPFSFSLQRRYIMRLLKSDAQVLVKESKSDESKSVLLEAHRLARLLLKSEREERWKIISGVWVEMLSYAARNCSAKHHAERLCDGGEFLTKIWLLMAHLGMLE